MTKKELTIRACRKLIQKYENTIKQKKVTTRFFNYDDCPLCDIHHLRRTYFQSCKGCPLANEQGNPGCLKFKTYEQLEDDYLVYYNESIFKDVRELVRAQLNKSLQARADFHKKIIPILENISEERFTKEGWIYFKELKRSW